MQTFPNTCRGVHFKPDTLYFFFFFSHNSGDSCQSLPCKNKGECINRKNGGYICRCERPYEGKTCDRIAGT